MPEPTNPLLNEPKPDDAPKEPADAAPKDDAPLGGNGEKALKSERARAAAAEKERDALKAKLDGIAKQQMTDLERAQAEAAEAKAEADRARADALRFRIATDHSITAEDAELFLTGSDEATLLKQAARLVERSPSGPVPDPSQGGSGDPLPLNGDPLLAGIKQKLGIS